MKKRIASAVLASAVILSVASCGNNPAPAAATTAATTAAPASKAEEGKVLRIAVWNEEWKGFFNKYYAGTEPIKGGDTEDTSDDVYYDKAPGLPAGVTVEWEQHPSDDLAYQKYLDQTLPNNASAAADSKIDMFLGEADYVIKYVNTPYSMDIAELGITDLSQQYQYTIDACTDTSGKVKGLSFQVCPSAMVYRRSIAKALFGSDDPAEVQKQVDTWDKFNAVAKKAKEQGYMMTPSYLETYRAIANTKSIPWVNDDGTFQVPPEVDTWIKQADSFIDNGYTLEDDLWGSKKAQQFLKTGKAFCVFGPAWYFKFCMGATEDPQDDGSRGANNTIGDWALCAGPQEHFWGGTWMLPATGTDNPTLVGDVLNAFANNEDILSALIENESSMPNNKKMVAKYAADSNFGLELLGGQNFIGFFKDHVDGIKFSYPSPYDQKFNEQFPQAFLPYFKGDKTYDECLAVFKQSLTETYPEINVG